MNIDKLKGTQTEKNLYMTFAGEARARSRYNFYSEKARAEGYHYIGKAFDEAASHEYAHAREVYSRFLSFLGSTEDNLREAICGEAMEYSRLYKSFERVARKEGFEEIANFYKEIAEVEEFHEKRFKRLYDRIVNNNIFTSHKDIMWQCLNCGHIDEGRTAPESCRVCGFTKSFFKPLNACYGEAGGEK